MPKSKSSYEVAQANLKKIERIQDLLIQGLGKHEDREEALSLAKETAKLFNGDVLKRKAEKLAGETIWRNLPKSDVFLSPKEAEKIDPWIELIKEFLDARKVKKELNSENIKVISIIDGEDQHLFITEKGSKDHVQLIIDGGTGEIRIDPNDQAPGDLIQSVEAVLRLKTGEHIHTTRTSLTFADPGGPEPDLRAFTSDKDNYFVLELFNCGDDDLEEIHVLASWSQPEGQQERDISKFCDEHENLMRAHAKDLNILKKGERVFAHIPSISIDGNISFSITYRGIKSKKKATQVFNLKTKNIYP